MILVTGAGGKTGRALIKTLSKAESVFAFVHREGSVAALKALGAETILVGDLRDATDLARALQGARAVYHICPNMSAHELEIGESVILQARAAGAEHFVYHSVLHPQAEKMPHHWQKLRVEELLFESGLQYTIMQPAPYMQNVLAEWDQINQEGVLRVPYSIEARFSFVDIDDVAEAGKIVLTGPGHAAATYELVGENSLAYAEVAEIFARALERTVRAQVESVADWSKRKSGLAGYERENLIKMFNYYDSWGLTGNSNVLRWLLGREPISFDKFVTKTVRERNAVH